MLLGDIVPRNARLMPDKTALVWQDRRISWQALNERINKLANALIRLGVGPGERVAYIMDNCAELVELHFATAKVGAVSVPILPRSVPREIAQIVNDVGARALIVGGEFSAQVAAMSRELPTVAHAVGVGQDNVLAEDYDRLVADAPDADPGVRVDPDSIYSIKFTSGTTGVPKGCMRSHRQMLTNVLIYLAAVHHDEHDRATISSPFAAGFATHLLNVFFTAGVEVVVLPKFDPLRLLETIERDRVTLAYAIQATFNEFTRHPALDRFDLRSLRLFTGTSASQDTLEGLRRLRRHPRFRAGFLNAYGSTEAGGYISHHLPADYARELADPALAARVESIGRPAPLCRVEAMGEDLRPLPPGEVGEMAVKAPSLFSGYWNLPDETARVMRQGWLVTGDMAFRDEEGFLYLAGRTRDMIKTGGINVYPAEIEAVLASCPKVAESAVVGVPDRKWGEMVVACVVAREPVSEEELLAFCAERLAGYKKPKAIYFWDDLPKNETGKIVKKTLRAELERRAAPARGSDGRGP